MLPEDGRGSVYSDDMLADLAVSGLILLAAGGCVLIALKIAQKRSEGREMWFPDEADRRILYKTRLRYQMEES
jgi:hypothetical protein